MLRLVMIGRESAALADLRSGLSRCGFTCSILPHGNGLIDEIVTRSPDLVLIEADGHRAGSGMEELLRVTKQERSLPVIALIDKDAIADTELYHDVDDFLVSPYNTRELVLRIKRLLHNPGERESAGIIKCDGLTIDLSRCEVSVGGKVVELTFKEYELLKLLAGNRGRVYTREALLNIVWGYNYYGGDRTVDVHIRRLRSKIEDSSHTFIETVRNIGYRFKRNPEACN